MAPLDFQYNPLCITKIRLDDEILDSELIENYFGFRCDRNCAQRASLQKYGSEEIPVFWKPHKVHFFAKTLHPWVKSLIVNFRKKYLASVEA